MKIKWLIFFLVLFLLSFSTARGFSHSNCSQFKWTMQDNVGNRASSTWNVCSDKIEFSVTVTSSEFYYFNSGFSIVQNGKQFDAKSHYVGSLEVKYGVTVTDWIDQFPTWFNVFSPFRIYYLDNFIDVNGAPISSTTSTHVTTSAKPTTTTTAHFNNNPYQPSNPYPTNGAALVPSDIKLSWDGGDPDNDDVVYNIYLGTGAEMGFYRATSTEICEVNNLQSGTPYKWKVVAIDNYGATNEGPIWTFTTVNASICAAETVLEDDSKSLELLRQFRDEVLAKSSNGKALIKLYYKKSPQVVELIEKTPALKEKCRIALKAIIPSIRTIVKNQSDFRK
jgi:hypothetical protein